MFRTKEDCSFIVHIIHGKKEYEDIIKHCNKKQQFSKITMQIILQNV